MNPNGSHRKRLTYSRANDASPTWSPDGRRIAFASNRAGNLVLGTGYALFVMDASGLHQRRLTFVQAEDGLPAWSPDGKRIAFLSQRSGSTEVYVMRPDGTRVRRLTQG